MTRPFTPLAPRSLDAQIENRRAVLEDAIDRLIDAQEDLAGRPDDHALYYLEGTVHNARCAVWYNLALLKKLWNRAPSQDDPDNQEERACAHCGRTYPLTFAFFSPTALRYLNALCRPCERARDRAAYPAQREILRAYKRAWYESRSPAWHEKRRVRQRASRARHRALVNQTEGGDHLHD